MTPKARRRYTATTVGASSVTLTVKPGYEDEALGGDRGIFGPIAIGTIVLNTGGVPSAQFWRNATTGAAYLVEISRVN